MPVTRDVLESIHQRRSGSNPGSDLFATIDSFTRTAAEIAANVTPLNYAFTAHPYVDPRRYGADPSGVADSTTAVQTAINIAYAIKGIVWIGNGCNFKCGALSLTFTGNHGNDGLRIMGSSVNGSMLTLTGAPSAFLTLTGSTPTGNPQESPIVLENFTLNGPGGATTTDGLLLQGVAFWKLRRMWIFGFQKNVYLNSALTGEIEDCLIWSGKYGIYARRDGTGSGNNLVKIRGGSIGSNSTYGIDWDAGEMPRFESIDMESNGTTGNTSTGAIVVRSTTNFATGEATVVLEGMWFEGNLGQCVKFEAITQATLSIKNSVWYTNESGRCLLIAGGARVDIENCNAQGVGDTFDITCAFARIMNTAVTTLTDTGITTPTYINVTTSGGNFPYGRPDSFTATIATGLTTTPTGTVNVLQQGNEINFLWPSITGTSNATGMTITGVPAKYQPATYDQQIVMTAFDNGVVQPCPMEVDHASGTITAQRVFTNTGTKGILKGLMRFFLI